MPQRLGHRSVRFQFAVRVPPVFSAERLPDDVTTSVARILVENFFSRSHPVPFRLYSVECSTGRILVTVSPAVRIRPLNEFAAYNLLGGCGPRHLKGDSMATQSQEQKSWLNCGRG